jgi:hypothetical protein
MCNLMRRVTRFSYVLIPSKGKEKREGRYVVPKREIKHLDKLVSTGSYSAGIEIGGWWWTC